ncbi:NADH dehydrogenase (Ubiquinone), RnfE subunit [Paracholeplasma brassicae]|uniref:Ion-translocating oxidoreductase complex subunit E n=1 Tax=Acholeplasma brassicae TaxID=61635 RepID=U4KMC8_9MOLU|nr:electron transport complex subunit RsxE [Paracholeplasma brassicae]CCV65230.1 NADH dehydrogenase (Ubiquinone), RnfE subunit [Paracholeplasma brassicae]
MSETVTLKKKDIFMTGVLKENATFKMMLGMCPALAVTSSFESAFGMGILVIIILSFSNGIISLLRKLIPSDVRIPAYIVIIATLVTALKMFVDAYAPALASSLGVFIALIAVNCIVLGRAESFASKNTVLNSIVDGLGSATGFTLSISLIGLVREVLGKGSFSFGVLLPLPFEFTWQIFPSEYAWSVLVSPPGAFLVIGILLAGFTAYGQHMELKKKLNKAKARAK